MDDAIALSEAKLDAADIDAFMNSAFLKALEKHALRVLSKVEAAHENLEARKASDIDELQDTLRDELDDLEYFIHMFKGLDIINFPADQTNGVTKLLRSANNSIKAAEKIIDNEEMEPEAFIKRFPTLKYSKLALTLATNIFAELDLPWDYDHTWENYLGLDKSRPVGGDLPEARIRKLANMVWFAIGEGKTFKLNEESPDFNAEEAKVVTFFYELLK